MKLKEFTGGIVLVLDVMALAIVGGFVLSILETVHIDPFMLLLLFCGVGYGAVRGKWIHRTWKLDKAKKEAAEQRHRDLLSRS